MTDMDPAPDAAAPLPAELERLAHRLAEALPAALPSLGAPPETWLAAARAVLRQLGAEAHPQFEDFNAPGMLTFTFRDVPRHDPRTGTVEAG